MYIGHDGHVLITIPVAAYNVLLLSAFDLIVECVHCRPGEMFFQPKILRRNPNYIGSKSSSIRFNYLWLETS